MAGTNTGLVDYCLNKIGTPYVYGMKMQVMTREMFENLKRLYGTMVWDSDISKVGKVCCDCSGLISAYTGVQRGSTQFKDAAKTVNPIATVATAPIGALVWKQGHIGVYAGLENGKPVYIAEDGSASGCRKGALPGVFTHWFLCPDLMYAAASPAPASSPAGKSPVEVTVDNAAADGVLVDKAHWVGVLSGKVLANPGFLKTILDRYHDKCKK